MAGLERRFPLLLRIDFRRGRCCPARLRFPVIDFAWIPAFYSEIRAKKPKPVKSGAPRTAGRIEELAIKGDIDAAEMLAIRGREFTLIEDLLYGFYRNLSDVQKMKAGQKTELELHWPDVTAEKIHEIHAYLEKSFKGGIEALCAVFIGAVESKDEKKLIEFSKAIKFLKTFEKHGDDTRSQLLLWKKLLVDDGRKWTIGQLAKVLNRPRDEAVNGYATLRKMAEKVNFPLKQRS